VSVEWTCERASHARGGQPNNNAPRSLLLLLMLTTDPPRIVAVTFSAGCWSERRVAQEQPPPPPRAPRKFPHSPDLIPPHCTRAMQLYPVQLVLLVSHFFHASSPPLRPHAFCGRLLS
jgi:hypothetical protein